MPLKNSNTVAVERRMDLASLFCMIGRHGPAVALAVIAMVSVLAGFIIYRTVRGKRRKATAAAEDGDGKSREAERDESVIHQSPEESHSSVESTDVSDEGSEVKEAVDLIQSDLKVRHRCVAAAANVERTPPPPQSEVQVPDNEHDAPDDTQEVYGETYAEKANQSLLSDACTEAEVVLEDVAGCHQGENDDEIKDVLEEFHDEERCTEELEVINDEHQEEEEEVLTTEREDVTMDEDVSIKTAREEKEDNIQGALNNPMCFEQTPCLRENSDDDTLQDDKTTNDMVSNSEENPDSYSVNGCLSPEEEKKKENKETESLDQQLIDTCFSTSEQETNLPSTQQEQCDHVMDKGTTPIQGNDWDEDGSLAGEEDINVKFDAQSTQIVEQDMAIELQEENGLMCDQEDGLYHGANQAEVEMPSQEIENQPEHKENGTTDQLAEEEEMYDPQMIRNEDFDEARVGENVTPTIMTEVFDKAADPDTVENVPSVVVEDMHCPHLSSISQDQQSDQTKDFSQLTTGAAPVAIEDMDPPMCQIRLPSLEQFEQWDNGILSAGVGEESGISSMTVSPDAGNEFDVIFDDMVLQPEGQREAQNSLFADDAAISVIKEDTAGMVFGTFSSHNSQPLNYESLAANEDMFGQEIEDSYHRAVDQFMTEIADSVTSFIDDLEKKSDVNVFVEVTDKKAAVNTEKKEETEQEEDDYEKTEISIMEATMDHNEWIMDSNYQALPWMNLCSPSFAQDTKTNQLPTEECQSSPAVIDACLDTTNQTSAPSLVDESTENSKKVVAVQPMPQNVNVTFRVHYFTQSPYQTVAVTGSQQELGNWKGFVPLERAKDGHWAAVVSLPVESLVEWKFVVVDKGEVCRWEECGNRLLDTGFGDDLLVHKLWGRL